MYIHSNTKKYILKCKVREGINEDTKEYITPGFILKNDFYVNIENHCKLIGIPNHTDLKGLKLISIQEKKDEYIKFIFDTKVVIEIDMTESGYEGPEALLIGNYKEHYLDVIRGDEWID